MQRMPLCNGLASSIQYHCKYLLIKLGKLTKKEGGDEEREGGTIPILREVPMGFGRDYIISTGKNGHELRDQQEEQSIGAYHHAVSHEPTDILGFTVSKHHAPTKYT